MTQQQEQQQQQDQELEPVSPEDRIRMRAYYLWEQATDPKGTPDQYWEQARAEAEERSAGNTSPSSRERPEASET